LSGGAAPQQNSGQQSSGTGCGCGGCIAAVFLILIVLLIFGRLAESGSTVGLIVFVIALVGVYVIWQFRNKPSVRQAEVTPDYEWLGQEVKAMTGLVTIESLKEKTKELVELLEPLLKVELRQLRQSSNARILLEQDIRAIIIRLGLSNGSISEYAAHLYLELFKALHPKTFAGWKVHDALDVLQNILEKSRDTYTGSPKKPFTLEVVERMDAAHGTGITKPTRDLFLIIAVFAASVDGKVPDQKQTEIAQLKATLEAHG